MKLAVKDPSGKAIGESKTSVRRGQPNPIFKETFMFQIPLHQLADVSLLFSVYTVRSLKRKDMLGWFTIGKYLKFYQFQLKMVHDWQVYLKFYQF